MSELFIKAIENFPLYRDMLEAADKGQTPLSVSGISAVHKAHFALGLGTHIGKPMLIITDEEASAKRLSDDINSLSGETRSLVYPAKYFTFTAAEGVSR